MRKELVNKFISMYYLGGIIKDAVQWEVNNKTVTAKITSEDRTVMGTINANNFDLEDCNLIIRDTTDVLKQLAPHAAEIQLSLQTKDEKVVNLLIDSNENFAIHSEQPLGDESILRKTASLKQKPAFELTIELNAELVSKILSIKGSIADSKTFTFVTKDDKLQMIVGYASDINTTKTTIELPVTFNTQIDLTHKSFSSDNLAQILQANKDLINGTISIFSQGLIQVAFEHDGLTSEYYLIQLKNV